MISNRPSARARALLVSLLPVATLLAACSSAPDDAVGIGSSAMTDVTCGGRFPKAEAPYAQRPDGCSSIGDDPSQVRDSWGSADFHSTCQDHDRCYYTLGSNVDHCNDAFCDGVTRACEHAYCTRGGVRLCTPVVFDTCMLIAKGYCAAVHAGAHAGSVYHDAQDKQREWEACMATQGPTPPPPPPVVCPNGKPEGATWTERKDGSRCTTSSFRCLNGHIDQTGSYTQPRCIEP